LRRDLSLLSQADFLLRAQFLAQNLRNLTAFLPAYPVDPHNRALWITSCIRREAKVANYSGHAHIQAQPSPHSFSSEFKL